MEFEGPVERPMSCQELLEELSRPASRAELEEIEKAANSIPEDVLVPVQWNSGAPIGVSPAVQTKEINPEPEPEPKKKKREKARSAKRMSSLLRTILRRLSKQKI